MRIIALIAITSALVSCGGKSGKKAEAAPDQAPRASFAEVNAILKDKCSLCHNPADGDAFIDNEANLKAAGSDISTRIQATDRHKMPMMRATVPLTPAETETFLVYLGKAQPAAGAAVPNFADVSAIVDAKCARCHNDKSFAAPKFVGHEDVFKAEGDEIAAAVTATSSYEVMPPPANDRTLSADEKAKILSYLAP
jgi:uncharacterized membrane protein